VDSVIRADVSLAVGDVTQSVEASADAALLQTENASLGQVVAARSVQELPLNGRNVLNLINYSPGVVPQGSSEGSLTGKNVLPPATIRSEEGRQTRARPTTTASP
jgi:hypothetical protein